jgi:outer membrane protein assembly factor BamB/predicted Ser/Thr protein kinase
MSSKKSPTRHDVPSSSGNWPPASLDDPTLAEDPGTQVPKSVGNFSTHSGKNKDVVRNWADPATTVRLAEVLEEYLERLRRNEAPSREQFLAEHPDLAGELEACLAGLEFIQAMEVPLDSAAPQLGDFQIIREIGRGGMGAVYEAQQISLPRRVAIKVLRFGVVPDREAVERFRREAETVAGLHHTNIVPIFSVGQENGVNYYAMQFIDGPSLADVAATDGAELDPRRVGEWGLQAAEALAHAHQRGVVHRDVKPSNLLLDREQRIWLTDFGLAKRHDDVTLSLVGVLLGTPRYMSPEQASAAQQPIDHRTDIYSLGATLYELLTGEPLFTGRSPHNVISQILTLEPRPPRQVRPSLPRDLETILLKCLSKKANGRYHSASDLADDLRAFLDERPIRARRASLLERSARWWRQQKRSVVVTGYTALASMLLMVLALGGYQAWQAWQRSFVRLLAQRGVVTAEWFSSDGAELPGVQQPILRQTLPSIDPTPLPAGRYQVRVSGDDRLSESWEIDLPRGSQRDVSADLDHQFLWSDRDVRHGYDFWQHDDRTDLLVYHPEGFEIIDGSQGHVIRNVSLPSDSSELLPAFPGFAWPAASPTSWGDYRHEQRAHLTNPSLDCDRDGADDIILAGKNQAWVMAISSESGGILWFRALADDVNDPNARSNGIHPRTHVRSGILEPPLLVGDLNQDGTDDFVVNLFELDSNLEEQTGTPRVHRRLEALSGNDGTTIWQLELPAAPFQLSPEEGIPQPFRFLVGPNFSRSATGGFSMPMHWFVQRRPAAVELEGDAIYVQGRIERLPGDGGLALAAGSQLLIVDPQNGEWREVPHELPWRTDLPLRWGYHAERHECFVLLVERLASDPALASPTARIGVYSPAQRKLLWERSLDAYWPQPQAWHLAAPPWPLMVSSRSGGGSDILVPVRSSASASLTGTHRIPWGELACLDAWTGEQRWERRIRTSDTQVDHFVVGPDLDGDGEGEIYVASLWGRRSELYVEALSRSTGKSLWISRQALTNVDEHISNFQIHRLDWWHVSYRESGPQLIVHLLPDGNLMDPEGHSLVQLIAARDGTWTRTARNFQDSWVRDMDGDGVHELLLFRSRSLHFPESGGSLYCLQGIASEPWRLLNSGLTVIDDVNHDGYGDLLQASGDNRLTAFSGYDGRVLWSSEARADGSLRLQPVVSPNAWGHEWTVSASALPSSEVNRSLAPPQLALGPSPLVATPGDLNGDGTPDLIGYPSFGHFSSEPLSVLHAFSGRDGRQLWTAPIRVTNMISLHEGGHAIQGIDLDGDGLTEIVFVGVLDYEYPVANFPSTDRMQLWCFVLSGHDGSIRWKQPLSQAYGIGVSVPNVGHVLRQRMIEMSELAHGDLDGDGIVDLIVPAERSEGRDGWELRALSGRDGQLLWRRPMAPCVEPDDAYSRYVPPMLIDRGEERGLAGVVLEFPDRTLAGELGSAARLTCFSARDGREIWTWETGVSREWGGTCSSVVTIFVSNVHGQCCSAVA